MHMIPAYSPQARGRSERNFSTWQDSCRRIRLRGIRTLEEANRFINEHYIAEFNRRFTVPSRARNGIHLLPAQEPRNGLHTTI